MTAVRQGFGVTLRAWSDINRRFEFRCLAAVGGNEFR